MTLPDRRALSLALAAALTAATPALARAPSDVERAAARTSFSGAYLAGRIAGSLRDVDSAAAYFAAALRLDPRNPQLLERTFLLSLAEGDMDESMRLAERVVSIDPANRVARLALAVRSMKARQYVTARSHLSQGLKGPLADLTVNLISAWAWLGSNDPTKALDTIDRLEGADFFGSFREYHAALIADLAGRDEIAARRYAAALSGDGAALRIVQAASVFRARTGKPAEALKSLDEFDRVAPRHPLIREAREAITAGRAPQRPVADVSDGVAEVLYGIGGALARQGGEDLAIVYLQLALMIEPAHPMALVTLADLYDQLNQYQLAIDTYDRVPDSSPLKRNAAIQTAIDLDRLDRTDEAKKRLGDLIKADSQDQEAIVALGNIERSREQFAEAAATYSKAIALISEPAPAASPAPEPAAPTAPVPAPASGPAPYVIRNGDTFWKLAQAHLGDGRRWIELAELNRTPEAVKANGWRIPRSNALAPGRSILLPQANGGSVAAAQAAAPPPEAVAAPIASADRSNWSLYYVRGIAYERSKDWARSESDLKKALELYPDQPVVLNYLGYSWIDQGINLDEGMKMIRKAVELRPDDGYIVDSLGWAHFRLGAYDDAVRELERAVELRPQDPVMNDHLGDAYWRVGRELEARFQWSHAKDLKPEPADLAKIEVKLKDGLPDAPKTDAAGADAKKDGG